MKVLTVLGTRPEIIRLSRVIAKLDALCDHVLVHTGQNYDAGLSDIFFRELGVRAPNHSLDVRGATFGDQVGQLLSRVEPILRSEQPDRVLVLGDTNSGLVALVAKRVGIPVYHMEAGNRCYDDRVPEEVNRRVIDHSSDVLLPYTERSRTNLLREGIASDRVFVTGNPISEVINYNADRIESAGALLRHKLVPRGYFLATMHRAENVDSERRLRALTEGLVQLHKSYELPVVCSLHPRTRNKMEQFGLPVGNADIRYLEPLGFLDFIALERSALCVLSDSGTVQEECCLFEVPNVTIRDVTERPETIECGSNMLSGAEPEQILSCVRTVLAQRPRWYVPREYRVENVSDTVVKLMLGFRLPGPGVGSRTPSRCDL